MKFVSIFVSFFLIMSSLLCFSAVARESDGSLSLIQTPNNGIPVITTPDISFTATLQEEATLTLKNGDISVPLTASWTSLPGGLVEGQCQVPQDIPPGTYTLQAKTESRLDANIRSVYILESFPQEYRIAHVTDVHIGTTRHPRKDSDIITDIINTINESDAMLVLFTGDLTENGHKEQFQRFLLLLDACNMPTVVVSGNHDREDHHYEEFFCKQTYAFWFGEDAYLGYDTKDYLIADEAGEQDGLLYYYRRQIRAARWSIGFTHRYDLTMGVRAQLILFVDDPLDYVLYGHYHREATDQDGIPWGKTRIIMTPAAINGQFRFITVDSEGLHPQETLQAAAITLDDPPTYNTQANPD